MPIAIENGGIIEVAPGRGDLRFGSVLSTPDSNSYPSWLGLHSLPIAGSPLVGGRPLSYANIFACQPWVAAAVMRLLTWSVRVPLKAYRRTGDDSRVRLRRGDHPIADAIITPWERGCSSDLVQALLLPLLVHGNGTVYVDEGASGRIAFNPRDWRYIRPIQALRNQIAGWSSVEDGEATYAADQVLHVAWFAPTGPLGISPLQQLGVTIDIEDASRKFAVNTMRNMARPPSAITLDPEFVGRDRAERDQIVQIVRDSVNQLYSGPENAGKAAILPPGVDWKSVGHSAVETQLIEQRMVNREEIAAVYQVPPTMIGDLRHATYSNVNTQRDMAYTDSLGPYLQLISDRFNAQVIRGLLRDDEVYVEFDYAAVLRGDRLKEMQAIREGIATGVLTPNEGRSALNYPRSEEPDADRLYLPDNNLGPIGGTADDLTEITTAAQKIVAAIDSGVLSPEEARSLLGIDAFIGGPNA